MSAVLERIEQTRDALLGALASRDWEAITELDLSCRVCVEDVLAEASANEQGVRSSLEELLDVYRQLIDVASGDLGASAVRKFDIEAWIPTQQAYREVTSTSNCTQFQARRLNIRYKDEKGTKAVATLNGTLVAIPRTIVAILENHQQKDGSVKVPKALIPFLGMDTLVIA